MIYGERLFRNILGKCFVEWLLDVKRVLWRRIAHSAGAKYIDDFRTDDLTIDLGCATRPPAGGHSHSNEISKSGVHPRIYGVQPPIRGANAVGGGSIYGWESGG